MTERIYDLMVIGGGPGGYPAALKAAALGKSVALAECRDLGGTCLNRGCIPTKTLLHSAELLRELSRAGELGIRCGAAAFDAGAFWGHKDRVVGTLRDGIAQTLKKQKVDVFQGKAQVASVPALSGGEDGPFSITVTGKDGSAVSLRASHVLLAAGSRPAMLPIPGMEAEGVMNSDTVFDENRLGQDPASCPESMVIIGGGVIGMEMATAYSSLGCRVTVLEAMDRILPGMDKEISQNLKMILKKRGVEIITSAFVKEVEKDAGNFICRYTVKNKKGEEEAGSAAAAGLLVSTGRKPAADGLFSEDVLSAAQGSPQTAWLFTGRGYLKVDENYETAIPGIYGAGDIVGGIQLAHAATAECCRAVEHMFGLPYSQDLSLIPSCVYTDPEIACIGLTADEAKAAGMEVKTGKYIMSVNGKSVLTLQERGFIKLVAEKETGRLLGAQLMCARATDMVGELGLAIAKGLTAADLAAVVMAHPTFAEGIGEAAAALG